MKWIWSPSTELRHISAVYIVRHCDHDLWPVFSKIRSRDRELVLNICAILNLIDLCVFEICVHKMLSLWPHCKAFSVAMATILCPTHWEVVIMLPLYELDRTTQYWAIAIFTDYITWYWRLHLGIESCHMLPLGKSTTRFVDHQLHWILLMTQVDTPIGYGLRDHDLQNGGFCRSKTAINSIESMIMLLL